MTFPLGWPPRPASGRRSIRFYQTGTTTADYSDNAFLFINGAAANTFVPTPNVPPGAINTTVAYGDYTAGGSPMGGGVMANEPLISPMIWAMGIRVTNTGSNPLQVSFDGTNVHGYVLNGTDATYLWRHEAGIALSNVTTNPTTTLSGNGTAGMVNGTAGAGGTSEFNAPDGLAVDSSGNVYVADSVNNVIRKITPAGVPSTFSGTGSIGFVDGASGTAQYFAPSSVCLDSNGNVYVADFGNNAIRKLDSTGKCVTLCGNGNAGFINGTGGKTGTSEFNNPWGIAVDPFGNVYVTDEGNDVIRKIDPNGNSTTFTGSTTGFADGSNSVDGTGPTARFNSPAGLVMDIFGNLFVGDSGNNRIRKITPNGDVSTVAGNGVAGFVDGTGGASGTSEFHAPQGVAIDGSGNIFVADSGNNRIRKIDSGGNVTTLAGNGTAGFVDGTGGASGSTEFRAPFGVAVDLNHIVYVGDTSNNRIRKIAPTGASSTTYVCEAW